MYGILAFLLASYSCLNVNPPSRWTCGEQEYEVREYAKSHPLPTITRLSSGERVSITGTSAELTWMHVDGLECYQ